jgi:hypothetical protein
VLLPQRKVSQALLKQILNNGIPLYAAQEVHKTRQLAIKNNQISSTLSFTQTFVVACIQIADCS